MNEKLKITPLTRIGDLLDAFPELDDVLIGLAPAFSKLKNPILRRTVAKVATVQKAASIAGIDAEALLQAGEVPLGRVVQAARGLAGDQFLLVTSGFRPVPLIEALGKQGHRGFVRQIGPDRFETYVGPCQKDEIQE